MRKVMSVTRMYTTYFVRGNTLWALFAVEIFFLSLGYFFACSSISNRTDLILKDFGLFFASITSAILIALYSGFLTMKDFEQKLLLTYLSKPLSRGEFIAARFLTLSLVSLMSTVLLTLVVALLLWSLFGSASLTGLGVSLISIALESVLLSACATFFSGISTLSVWCGLFTISVFLSGRSSGWLRTLSETQELTPGIRTALKTTYFILPHFDMLNLTNAAVNGSGFSASLLLSIASYTLCYALVIVLVATKVFSRRTLKI